MSTLQLVVLRLYMVTLGRAACLARLLRRVLVWCLITRRSTRRYTASARFFDMRQLENS